MTWFKAAALAVAFAVAALSVSGCNTIRGLGRDIEKGGEKIQDAAQ